MAAAYEWDFSKGTGSGETIRVNAYPAGPAFRSRQGSLATIGKADVLGTNMGVLILANETNGLQLEKAIPSKLENFSIEVFARPQSGNKRSDIVSQGNSWRLQWFGVNSRFDFIVFSDATKYTAVSVGATADEWHKISASLKPGEISITVDGVTETKPFAGPIFFKDEKRHALWIGKGSSMDQTNITIARIRFEALDVEEPKPATPSTAIADVSSEAEAVVPASTPDSNEATVTQNAASQTPSQPEPVTAPPASATAQASPPEPSLPAPKSSPSISFNPGDLLGKWLVSSSYSSDKRTFEFLPDGRVVETSTYTRNNGESTQVYYKTWSQSGDKILIVDSATSNPSDHSLSVDLPLDPSKLQIAETWTQPNSVRTNKLYATRIGNDPSKPAAVAAPSAKQQDLPKVSISALRSMKTDKDGYTKTQSISHTISVANQSIKSNTGPLKVNFWLIGKNSGKIKLFALFNQESFVCDLGPSSSTRETKFTTQPYVLKSYTYSPPADQYEYEGWIATATDEQGRMVCVKSSNPQWEALSRKLPSLTKTTCFDANFDPVQGTRGVPNYW